MCIIISLNGIPSVKVGSKFVLFLIESFVNLCLVCLSESKGIKIVFDTGIGLGNLVLNLNPWTNLSSPGISKYLVKI